MEEEDFNSRWQKVVYHFIQLTGKKPNLNTMLFLIGIQELGTGKKRFSKEEKQDLMHIAMCKVLSLSGYYELEGQDKDGWPHWKSIRPVPKLNLEEQENLLKAHIVEYFEKEVFV
jgi:hypothetical protein